MNDPSNDLFAIYATHYRRMEVVERLPADPEKLKRDRLPPWITDVASDARVIDLGCGQGHLLAALQRVGFTNLSGVDISPQQLAVARVLLPPSVALQRAELHPFLASQPDHSYDLVFLNDVLEHLPRHDTLTVLRHLHRVLAAKGRLSIRVPNSSTLIGAFTQTIDFTHVTHFSEYSLIQVLEAAGFSPDGLHFDRQAPRLFWSSQHPNRALLRLINRLRWHTNNWLHRVLYRLLDMHPQPTIFDTNLVISAIK
ncbi:MAG: class I SAM-dependent methyltransferase [Gammaproteobacteria bacterium]|nr:class I SAM-dependent methyltransferase [Gammaproteobacteria bacterium]